MLRFMGLRRVGHDSVTELNWTGALAWRIPWIEGAGSLQSMGFAKSRTGLSD